MRQYINLTDFKANYMDESNFVNGYMGYFPVYVGFKEDNDGNNLRALHIDLICEWRLPDCKIKLLEVPFDTPEQLEDIVVYLRKMAKLLSTTIIERVDKLNYNCTKG